MITRDENVAARSRSPWFVALGMVTVIFIISALMLLYYLTPGGGDLFREHISPTASSKPVQLTVSHVPFAIPSNFIAYASVRKGGERKKVEMFARLPGLDGWSGWQEESFTDNLPDSPILHFSLEADPYVLSEGARLKRVYGDYVENLTGVPAKFGLSKLTFRKDSGYLGRDMFVGKNDTGPVVLICERRSREVPSPNCLRQEYVAPDVSLRYRFKRSKLKHWKGIAGKMDALIASFRKAATTRAS